MFFWQINVLQAKRKFEILDAVSLIMPFHHLIANFIISVCIVFMCDCILMSASADAVLHARPVHAVPARIQHPGWDRPLHEKTGCAGESEPMQVDVFWERLTWPTLKPTGAPCCLLCAAGPAGHRLGHGEERDGAQARPDPAKGERDALSIYTLLLLLFCLHSLFLKISLDFCSRQEEKQTR